jgi:hypothetical protein
MIFPNSSRIKYIGRYGVGAPGLMQGYLDDVRLYNRTLTADEIIVLYNKTKSRYE